MDLIKKFVNQYDGGTRADYTYRLNNYFKFIKQNPDQYFKSNRDYEADVLSYWNHLKEVSKSLCTRNSKINAVKQFLIDNDVELSTRFWKKLRRSPKDKGKRAVTIDRPPTRKELRRIILEGKPMMRAISLIASSSGMRAGEIRSIVKEDVELDHDPPMIKIRAEYTKTGEARIVFISDEAKKALLIWYDKREAWTKLAVRRLVGLYEKKGKKVYDYSKDNRIFPIDKSTLDIKWVRMLKKAGFDKRDPTTGFHEMHFHVLRKYFRTNMAKPLGIDVTEALMGHSGYLTDAYRRYSIQQLGSMYKDAVKSICIFEEEPTDLTDINKQLADKDQQMKDMIRKIELMDQKIHLLEMQVDQEKIKNKLNSR